jgi:hypothetical protein
MVGVTLARAVADPHGVPAFDAFTDTGERVNLATVDGVALRRELHATRPADRPAFVCTHCGGRLVFRALTAPRWASWVDAMGPWPALFAHVAGASCRAPYRTAGESFAHADLKARAEVALRAVGATVDVEHRHANGCRSDVYATLGDRAVGLEIQVSGLATADAVDRHARYVDAVGRPDAVAWFASSWRPWSRVVPAMTLDADRARVVGGLWLRPGEVLAPPVGFGDAVAAFATGRIVTIDAGEGGAWVPWLRAPTDARAGRTVDHRDREPVERDPHVAARCDRLAPVAAFEVVPLFDDAALYVPVGTGPADHDDTPPTLPLPVEARPGALCTRCGVRPRGSFTGGVCVPCTTTNGAAA